VGIGELVLGSVTAGITLVALVGLRPLRRFLRRYARDRDEYLIDATRDLDLSTLLARIRETGAAIETVRIADEGADRSIRLQVRPSPRMAPADIAAAISQLEHIRNVDWAG
jgi:uncharacterized membrane protein YhiD involved in acid resistance